MTNDIRSPHSAPENCESTQVMPVAQTNFYASMPYPPTRTKRRMPFILWLLIIGFVLVIAGLICFMVALERAGSLHELAVRCGYHEPVPVERAQPIDGMTHITINCPDGGGLITKLENSPDDQIHLSYTDNDAHQRNHPIDASCLAINQKEGHATIDLMKQGSATLTGRNAIRRDLIEDSISTAFIPEFYAMSENMMGAQPVFTVQIPESYQGELELIPANINTSTVGPTPRLVTNFTGNAQITIDHILTIEGDTLATSGNLTINHSLLFIGKLQGKQVQLSETVNGLGMAHMAQDMLNPSIKNVFFSSQMPRETNTQIIADTLQIHTALPVIYDRVDAHHVDVSSASGFVSLGLTGEATDYTVTQSTGYTKDSMVVAHKNKTDQIIDTVVDEVLESSELSSKGNHHDDVEFNVFWNNGDAPQTFVSPSSFIEAGHLDRQMLSDGLHNNKHNIMNMTWKAGNYSGTLFMAYKAPLPTEEITQTQGDGPRTVTISAPHGHTDLTFLK